jgi:hypothetical protein
MRFFYWILQRFVCIGNRESALYKIFSAEVDWLIRAVHNSVARHPQGYLWKAVLATTPRGNTELRVPARGKVPQRTARLTLRCATVRLRSPRVQASRRSLPEVDVFAMPAIEDTPPYGVEPLEWMLLSSVPTTSLDEVLERLD